MNFCVSDNLMMHSSNEINVRLKVCEEKKIFLVSDYLNLETKKLYAGAQVAQLEASEIIDEYLNSFSFPSNSRVIIRVFDVSGRFITTLVDKFYESSGTMKCDCKNVSCKIKNN